MRKQIGEGKSSEAIDIKAFLDKCESFRNEIKTLSKKRMNIITRLRFNDSLKCFSSIMGYYLDVSKLDSDQKKLYDEMRKDIEDMITFSRGGIKIVWDAK